MFLGALKIWPDLSRLVQEEIHPELSKEDPVTSMVKVSIAIENIWKMMVLSILCFLSLILQHDYISISGRIPQHKLWRSTPKKIEGSKVMNQSEHLIEKKKCSITLAPSPSHLYRVKQPKIIHNLTLAVVSFISPQ